MSAQEKQLIDAAKTVLHKAYAPYSEFRVGAALLTEDGQMFTGCNVENSSYGLSVCAERIAVFKAVSEGNKKFTQLALVTETTSPAYPCGACRQVLSEFAPDLELLIASTKNTTIIRKRLGDLIPFVFGPDDLNQKLSREQAKNK